MQRELRGRVGSATADAIDCAQCQLPRGSNDGTVIGATAVDGSGFVHAYGMFGGHFKGIEEIIRRRG